MNIFNFLNSNNNYVSKRMTPFSLLQILAVIILMHLGGNGKSSGGNSHLVDSFTTTKNMIRFSSKGRNLSIRSSSISNIKVMPTTLSMHMGHSHSHQRHHGFDGSQSSSQNPGLSLSLSGIRRNKKLRRRLALFTFSAVAILGQSLVRNQFRSIGRTDSAVFFFTSILLWTSDMLRKELISTINKVKKVRDGVIKHSPLGMAPTFQFAAINKLFPSFPFIKKKESQSEISIGADGIDEKAAAFAQADNVTILGVIVNLMLSVGKFVIGVKCHSSALVADAGHSLSDLFSDFVTLYTVQIARLPPDDDHPYGHGKFEAIGALFLALTLLGTGLGVGSVANKELMHILSTQRKNLASNAIAPMLKIPKPPALAMAAISIVSKEWLFRITNTVGKKLNSQIIIANAWHHRSDAYSSILALLSIALAMYVPGLVAADSAAGLLVAGMICMTGSDILVESINQLSDSSNINIENAVTKIINTYTANNDDIISINRVRARSVGSSAIVDVSITISSHILSALATQTIEQNIKKRILDELPDIIDVEVHATTKKDDSMQITRETGKVSTTTNTNSILESQFSSSQHDENNNNIMIFEENDNHTHDQDHNHNHGSDHTHGKMNSLPCVSQIEATVRETALTFPHVSSVKSVTVKGVKFDDQGALSASTDEESTSSCVIDVKICLNETESIMIQDAKIIASELRESLINNSGIISGANILLDFT